MHFADLAKLDILTQQKLHIFEAATYGYSVCKGMQLVDNAAVCKLPLDTTAFFRRGRGCIRMVAMAMAE